MNADAYEVKHDAQKNLTVDIHCVFCPQTFIVKLVETDSLAPLPHHIQLDFLSRQKEKELLAGSEETYRAIELPTKSVLFYERFYTFENTGVGVKKYELDYLLDENKPYKNPDLPPLGLGKGLVFWICSLCIVSLDADPKKIYNELLDKHQLHLKWGRRGAA